MRLTKTEARTLVAVLMGAQDDDDNTDDEYTAALDGLMAKAKKELAAIRKRETS